MISDDYDACDVESKILIYSGLFLFEISNLFGDSIKFIFLCWFYLDYFISKFIIPKVNIN